MDIFRSHFADIFGEARPALATVNVESCANCGDVLHKSINDLEYMCRSCGSVIEADTSVVNTDEVIQTCGRLKVVGANSSRLQPNLYQSGSGITPAIQTKQLYGEYVKYRNAYIDKGGRAIPYDICELAADLYNQVQRVCVKRSQNKRVIMAACLHQACYEKGLAVHVSEISSLMDLQSKGISKGQNFIQSMVADGHMDVNVNIDPCMPEVNAIFAFLQMDNPKYDQLKDAILDIVNTAIKFNIGTSSVIRSKVAGAAFDVINRSPLIKEKIDIQQFCKECNSIRKNTIDRFTKELNRFHSKFIPIYEKWGLDSGKIAGSIARADIQ
jgi:DNA-directed RNA polymerase subunit M/transcription elongation factor TFIIS